MRVKLINKIEDSSITIGREYTVLALQSYNSISILNNYNNLGFYELKFFEVVDNSKPSFWIEKYEEIMPDYGDDPKIPKFGFYYAGPEQCSMKYFLSSYHDRVPFAYEIFWDMCKKLYNIENKGKKCLTKTLLFDVICERKLEWCKPTENSMVYEFSDNLFDNMDITVHEKYLVEEIYADYWYKIKNDKNIYAYYHYGMFS